jgi:hypothetical protein
VLSRGGVKGEDPFEARLARLVALVRGEGVKGIRPPAVFVEKRPLWLLRGVEIVAVAIAYVYVNRFLFFPLYFFTFFA